MPAPTDPGPKAVHWQRPARIQANGAPDFVSEAAVLAELQRQRVVYVGEQHASEPHHGVAVRILHALKARSASLAIGLEMVKRPFQPALDAYIDGTLEEDGLLTRIEWKKRWGYPFGYYRPIFAFARAHRIPLIALNAPDEWTRKVAREGLDALAPEVREALPALDLKVKSHRARLSAMFDAHRQAVAETRKSKRKAMPFENFYAAQVLWDETMAESVVRALDGRARGRTLVVIAGVGHTATSDAMPDRVQRRRKVAARAVTPVIYRASIHAPGGDYVWWLDDGEGLPKAPLPPKPADAPEAGGHH